jgi:hypothetical protein
MRFSHGLISDNSHKQKWINMTKNKIPYLLAFVAGSVLAWILLPSGYEGELLRLQFLNLVQHGWVAALLASAYCSIVCLLAAGRSATLKMGVRALLINLGFSLLAGVTLALYAVNHFNG